MNEPAKGGTFLQGLRRVFGFFTILPFSSPGSIADVASAGYLIPFVAAILGAAEGLTGWGAVHAFGQPVSAALMLAAALLLTGFHHADGLADLGDALMVHGDAARRKEVLKDRTMGIGALGTLLLTYLIAWAALSQLLLFEDRWKLVCSLIAVEIGARLAMLTVIAAGRSSHEGSGAVFVRAMKGARIVAAISISLVALALLGLALPPVAMIAAGGAAIAAGTLLILTGNPWLGGVGGDIMGAAVEFGRTAALLGLVAALSAGPPSL